MVVPRHDQDRHGLPAVRQPAAGARISRPGDDERVRALKQDDLRGMRFALNVFIGTSALWLLLRNVAGINPIWAIASMIASSEPVVKDALRMFARKSSTSRSVALSGSRC